MIRKTLIGIGLVALAACGGSKEQEQMAADSLQRDLALAPAESLAPINDQPVASAPAPVQPKPAPRPTQPKPSAPAPAAPAGPSYGGTLASGTEIVSTAADSLHSRHNKVGESFTATIPDDVKDANGHTVIPAGAVVTFRVAVLEPAKNKNDKDGKVKLEATQVTVDGASYAMTGVAVTAGVEHKLLGQGVTAGGAVRVGGGAAGGAVVGKVVGGKTGAIIGGIAGAAGGAVLANQTADRDVVVRPGMQVVMNLTSNFTLTPM